MVRTVCHLLLQAAHTTLLIFIYIYIYMQKLYIRGSNVHSSVCVCGERDGVLYLSLIHGVVTYVDNGSGVSLGGPWERHKDRDVYCREGFFSLSQSHRKNGL